MTTRESELHSNTLLARQYRTRRRFILAVQATLGRVRSRHTDLDVALREALRAAFVAERLGCLDECLRGIAYKLYMQLCLRKTKRTTPLRVELLCLFSAPAGAEHSIPYSALGTALVENVTAAHFPIKTTMGP